MRRVGYGWDERCLSHDCGQQVRYDDAARWLDVPNFESAERIRAVDNVLRASGTIEHLVPVPAREATIEELLLVHTNEHLATLRATHDQPLLTLVGEYTRAGGSSWSAAVLAAGSTLAAVDLVVDGGVDCAYVLVRPPGHHASADVARGTCLINNVAVAARYLQRVRGVEKVAIVDWDVHHGNGTEDIFYDDPSVLFVSLHQEDFYPPGRGRREDRGSGAGLGTTINVPLPPGTGDHGYLAALDDVVLPALQRFRPEVVLVSSGLDAAGTDPVGRMSVTADGFRSLASRLVGFAEESCGGRLVAVQEGGYSVRHMPWCVLGILEAMLDIDPCFSTDPIAIDAPTSLRSEAASAIAEARAAAEL